MRAVGTVGPLAPPPVWPAKGGAVELFRMSPCSTSPELLAGLTAVDGPAVGWARGFGRANTQSLPFDDSSGNVKESQLGRDFCR